MLKDRGIPTRDYRYRYPTEGHRYRELDLFTFPEAVPELGVRAGDLGAVAGVYEDGSLLDVEIAREDGTSAGFVDVRIETDGTPRIVGYSPLG